MIHGDSVYDIIDKQDHGSIQAELSRSVPQQTSSSGSHHHHHHHHHNSSLNASTALDGEQRMFLCRMNVSRNARRQMRFGDQKVRGQRQNEQQIIGHPHRSLVSFILNQSVKKSKRKTKKQTNSTLCLSMQIDLIVV